jgi:peroxiredoxin
MTTITPLIPRQKVPDLTVTTTDGGAWKLSEQSPENFTLVIAYRGLHCPICKGYLKDLDNRLADFNGKGVDVIVVSTDSEERTKEAKESWRLGNLTMAHGFSLDDARDWGLYISSGIGKTSTGVEEPEKFAEPGIFLIRPDGTLYFASVQTMPFARPQFAEIAGALDYVIAKDYPARGEIVDHNS